MSWSGPAFVIVIIAVFYGGWLINNWIRAKHGYPLEDEWGGHSRKFDAEADRKIMLLSSENENLNGKISHLEERIAVLERIVTDKAGRLSEEIEKLR
ncbi:MAG: hypothetical protein IBJ12_13690 [Sphingomonadaceae bacterium]|nr:hypothetical protein [Sphingomonadaceae bacterium]